MAANNWQPSDPEVARLNDRVTAGQARLAERIWTLEQQAQTLADQATRHAQIEARLTHLEARVDSWESHQAASQIEHRTRTWQLALAIVTGLVLPLASIGIIALLHLTSSG